jgi:hypothetical protein
MNRIETLENDFYIETGERIKFIKVALISDNDVVVTYSLNSERFVVVWRNINHETFEEVDFYIDEIKTDARNSHVRDRVTLAVIFAESDCALYSFIVDSFSSGDARDLAKLFAWRD